MKHTLKARYYIRYVDDFVILDADRQKLENHQRRINAFLKEELKIELHPEKSRIMRINERFTFLGFRNVLASAPSASS